MSRHRITVPLTHEGIDNAIKQIQLYKKDVEEKKREILKELAQLGSETAFDVYGDASVAIGVEMFDGGARYSIFASGERICFLEFGTGTATQVTHPFADKVPFEVIPGSWSVEHEKQFSTKGYWIAGGRKFTKTEPKSGMYAASKMMQERVVYIARKVFGT